MLTYQTAYLKANFPAEFMATNCSSIMDHKERLALYIEDIRRMGLGILPPDINESEADFTVRMDPQSGQPDAVRFGMAAVKNVSRTGVQAIVRAREEGGPFQSLPEFARRVFGSGAPAHDAGSGVLNRSALECLIKAGAFDRLEPRRGALLEAVDSVLATAARIRRDRSMGQVSLFGFTISFPQFTLVAEFVVMAIVLVLRPWGLLGKPQGSVRSVGQIEAPIAPAGRTLQSIGAAASISPTTR